MLTDEDKQWIKVELERVETALLTALLTAFHSWASPVEARQRAHSAVLRAIDVELESMADRLKKLEGK